MDRNKVLILVLLMFVGACPAPTGPTESSLATQYNLKQSSMTMIKGTPKSVIASAGISESVANDILKQCKASAPSYATHTTSAQGKRLTLWQDDRFLCQAKLDQSSNIDGSIRTSGTRPASSRFATLSTLESGNEPQMISTVYYCGNVADLLNYVVANKEFGGFGTCAQEGLGEEIDELILHRPENVTVGCLTKSGTKLQFSFFAGKEYAFSLYCDPATGELDSKFPA